MRKENNFTVTDFHQLLVLARLICLSEGEVNLNKNCWNKAVGLEKERRSRLV